MAIVFDDLLELAARIGIAVRHAPLGGSGGGLATIKGTHYLFIDLDASPMDQLEQTAQALGNLKELEQIFVRPDLRALLESYRTQPPSP